MIIKPFGKRIWDSQNELNKALRRSTHFQAGTYGYHHAQNFCMS